MPQAEPILAQDPDRRDVDLNIPQDWFGYWLRAKLQERGLVVKTLYAKEELIAFERSFVKAVNDAFKAWLQWSWERNIDNLWIQQFPTDKHWREQTAAAFEALRDFVLEMEPGEEFQFDDHPSAP